MMLKRNAAMFLVFMILLLSCQTSKTQVYEPPIESTQVTEATPVITPIVVDEVLETLTFYQPEDDSETDPQFYLWIEPAADDPLPSMTVECNGIESKVYSPTSGVGLNNHCILKTENGAALLILPDGSMILVNSYTIAQFNFAENKIEIILAQGELFNIVSQNTPAREYSVKTGDTDFQVTGTDFGVSLKDKLISVIINDGEVLSFICRLYENHTCMKWDQMPGSLVPFNKYTRSIGDTEWVREEFSAYWWESGETSGMHLADIASSIRIGYDKVCGGDYTYAAMVPPTEWGKISGNQNPVDTMGYREIDDIANDKNEMTDSSFCTEFHDQCFVPTTQPTMMVEDPDSSITNGGTSASACSMLPTAIEVISCDCSNVNSQGAWCEVTANGVPGDGRIPLECAQSSNKCR